MFTHTLAHSHNGSVWVNERDCERGKKQRKGDRWLAEGKEGRKEGWMDGGMRGCMDAWMDEWID